jgi:hypothetical protein
MSTLHSHTHCQAAPANATTQAWQRVCLSNRTVKPTDNQADEKEHRSHYSGIAKKQARWLIKTFYFGSNFKIWGQFRAPKSAFLQSRKPFCQLSMPILSIKNNKYD